MDKARLFAAPFLMAALASGTAPVKAQARTPMHSPSPPLVFAAMEDTWVAAEPRWLDIGDRPFNGFLRGEQAFSYSSPRTQVALRYDRAPSQKYFVGRLEARGLKPNFAYQVKLLGKPQKGASGWGARGDDRGNERIGYAGRWWCNSSHYFQTNFNDAHYQSFYKHAEPGEEHEIHGYLFSGVFVTDARGNADVDISGRNSYHITWQSWQNGPKEAFAGTWRLGSWLYNSRSSSPFYGYGQSSPAPRSVSLFYEFEPGRPQPVSLPDGTYNCRMVLTEESFHSYLPHGGMWQSVLASEEEGDEESANDIVFMLGAPAAPWQLIVTNATRFQVGLAWMDNSSNETGFLIERSRDGATWERAGTSQANSTFFFDANLQRGTAYAYRVRALNASGSSDFSNVVTARTNK